MSLPRRMPCRRCGGPKEPGMGRSYCDACYPGQRERYLRAYRAEPTNKARDLNRRRGERCRTLAAASRADPERHAAKRLYDRARWARLHPKGGPA